MSWGTSTPQETALPAPTPPPVAVRRYRCRLSTVGNVSAEIAKIYREARSGALPVDHASKYAHILSIIGRIIETSDLERRVADIEAKA